MSNIKNGEEEVSEAVSAGHRNPAGKENPAEKLENEAHPAGKENPEEKLENEACPAGKGIPAEKIKKAVCLAGRGIAAAAVAALLIWYCAHPDYYGEAGTETLFTSGRTYFMILSSTTMIAIALLPNRLSERANRILGWTWFLLSPFAVYFSLLYLNAVRFSIHFTQLNKIALYLSLIHI